MNLVAVAQVVDATNFITNSRVSKEALKSANILKSLQINALIEGPKGAGKESLATYISPNAFKIKNDLKDIESVEKNIDEIIILNIDRVKNIYLLDSIAKRFRILATASKTLENKNLLDFFSLQIYLPPLSERKEDIIPLARKFLFELREIFSEENIDLDLENIEYDLSENGDSVKKSVFLSYFLNSLDEKLLLELIERFLESKIGTKNDYKNYLYLYEVPLIKAGLRKFKSQLKMAQMFGLNRNTLRKKIKENEERL